MNNSTDYTKHKLHLGEDWLECDCSPLIRNCTNVEDFFLWFEKDRDFGLELPFCKQILAMSPLQFSWGRLVATIRCTWSGLEKLHSQASPPLLLPNSLSCTEMERSKVLLWLRFWFPIEMFWAELRFCYKVGHGIIMRIWIKLFQESS